MFDQLQDRFSKIFKSIKGQGKISEKNISDAIREIRIALLESDVNYKVVSTFINKVKKKALGAKVFDSVTPGQQFIKVVLDELILFLDSDDTTLNIKDKEISIIIMVGLQGSGKTTTSAKIASFLKREYKKNPMLIGADLQRLAAQDQLKILSEKVKVDYFSAKNKNVLKVIEDGLEYAKTNKNDVVIIDTSGRLHIDDKLINELSDIIKATNPNEVLYVIDGMTGQDGINSTQVFSEKCSLTGAVITKMDGSSGGGVALSIKEVTNSPIKFITSGENMNDIEKFDSERIARRILGLSDVIGLVEKAQKSFDNKTSREITEKILNNEFNLNDFSNQIKQFNKLGSMDEMIKYVPGLKKMKNFDMDKDQFKWVEAIINSMTKKEKINPSIINGSRRERIAKGSGRSINEVNRLLKQFNQIKVLMKKTKNMNFGKFPFKLN